MPTSPFWTVASVYGASAVALGAFGEHGLKKHVSEAYKIANWKTAAHYQLMHAAALLITSAYNPSNTIAASLFTTGMTMFSGSVYFLCLDAARFRWMGPVTPLGGMCLIGGWVALAVGKKEE